MRVNLTSAPAVPLLTTGGTLFSFDDAVKDPAKLGELTDLILSSDKLLMVNPAVTIAYVCTLDEIARWTTTGDSDRTTYAWQELLPQFDSAVQQVRNRVPGVLRLERFTPEDDPAHFSQPCYCLVVREQV